MAEERAHPEATIGSRTDHVVNVGESHSLYAPPADPTSDEAKRIMSHEGGLANARTEHY